MSCTGSCSRGPPGGLPVRLQRMSPPGDRLERPDRTGSESPIVRSGLCSLRRFLRLARAVDRDRLADQRLERRRIDLFTFVNVDRAAYVPLEARVEQALRILQ